MLGLAAKGDHMRIDAHQHFWHYDANEFSWIDDESARLRQDWLPADLEPLMAASGIDRTIAVQARQSATETDWLLSLSDAHGSIAGVIGWADLRSPEFPQTLDRLLEAPALCGLRHVVQAEPDGFLDGSDFNQGIRSLRGTRLCYDVLIFARQIDEATRFVDRHPQQAFILDHIAKPDIAHSGFSEWAKPFRELARRDNVCCKLSGMVTEAGPQWTANALRPYLEVALEAFGPQRLMAASDWPVLTVHCSYPLWWATLENALLSLSVTEREQVFGLTAQRVYKL
jgi:L-fuconolactonase